MMNTRIACPYCCTIQSFPEGTTCRQCGLPVPEKYIRYARKQAPLYLAVVGMSQHGKTTYLNSLTLAMDNVGKIAREQGAYLEALDDYTLTQLQNIRRQNTERKRTESTRATGLQPPLVFSLNKFMTDERQPLVIHDLPGEVFSSREEIEEYAPPLKLAQTIWFIVSLHDLEHENTEYSSIADLFNVYITGMERAKALPGGRNLHVVYTKADKLINTLEQEVVKYLREDPYTNLADQNPRALVDSQFHAEDYTYYMDTINQRLLDFTEFDVTDGISFINMAKDYNMHISFSVNTAIGRDHLKDNQMVNYTAYRVLDPLIWAMRNKTENFAPDVNVGDGATAGNQLNTVALILDTGQVSQGKIYHQKLPSHFFTVLSRLGEVSTYYIGTLDPMTQPGLEPSNLPPTNDYAPLIGPVLDQLTDVPHILFVTSQSMWDLVDYHNPDWHDRLAIVNFDPTQPYLVRRGDPWPNAITFDRTRTATEQVEEIVNKLFYKPI